MSVDTSRFLAALPTAPRLHLTGIGDRGVFTGVTLPAGDDLPERVAKVAEAYNKRGNVYFNPNAPAGETSPHKLTKGHIGCLRAIWADLDPLGRLEVLPSDDPDNPTMTGRAKEKLRLLEVAEATRESDFPPSAAIDSGNGVQLIWFLTVPVECTDEAREMVEKCGHRIEAALGGTENTANVDRVLRLPGTTNKPTAKKRQLGRTEVPARLLYVTGECYDYDDLPEMAEAFEAAIAPDLEKDGLIIREDPETEPEPEASAGPEVEIDPSLPAELLALLASDAKLRAAWTKGTKLGKGKDKSASGLDMSLTLYLSRKLDPGDLDLALRDYPFGQIGGGTLKGDKAERRIAEPRVKRQWAGNTDAAQQRPAAKANPCRRPVPAAALASVRETLRDQGDEPAPGGPSFLQARTANEVLKAQERKLRLQRLKGELIDRARATAQVFTLARQERDAWVQWPARVAADFAAELGLETHTVQVALEAAVKAQLAELAELKPRLD